ncbi:MAG: hypothetical protein NTY37_12790 [Methanothrix sp.]|nr:hypothetical protein [Methanothrix sp.]
MMKNVSVSLLALCLAIPLAVAGLINQPEVYSNVSPTNGSLYLVDHAIEGLDNYSYYYLFNLSNLDMDTRERCQDDLVLKILDPSNSTNNWIKPNQSKISCSDLVFKVNFTETFNAPFLGKMKYRLIDIGEEKNLEESNGPEIVFNFRNERSLKKSNNDYDYSVEARSSINNSTVYILYEDSRGKWKRYSVNRTYVSNNSEWKLLKWEDAKYFHRMEFVPDLSSIQNRTISSNKQSEIIRSPPLILPSMPESSKPSIVQEYLEDAANAQVIYSIVISNSGDIKIRAISVDDTLPANMAYLSSSFKYSEDGTLAEPRKLNNSDGTTTLTWSIGDLNSGQLKTIQLVAKYAEPGGVFAANKVRASGSTLGTIVETTSGPATKVLDLPGGGVG